MGFGTKTRPLDPRQLIKGYDYVPSKGDKGILRREKQRQKGQDIFNNSNLTEDEKKFQLQQLINEEKIHQNKFKPDKDRRDRMRERMLNKPTEEELADKYDKRTDGNWWTKT